MMVMMIINRMHCPLIVVPDWSVHHCRCACSRTWLDERSATRARSSGWPAATKVGLLLFPFSVLVYRVFVPKCDLEWGLYSYIFYDCYMSLLKNIQACTTIRIVSSTMCHNLLFSNQFKNWMRINQYAFIWNVFESSFQHVNQSVEEKAYFRHSRRSLQVHHRQAPASTECCRSRRQRHAEVRPRTHPSPARRAALAGRSSALTFPSTSAAQSTTVHDGLLHPHLRHCSSPASAARRLPSAVRTATPSFHVRSSGLFCGRPGCLELVTRLPARSVTFLWQFSPRPENFSFRVLLAYTAH